MFATWLHANLTGLWWLIIIIMIIYIYTYIYIRGTWAVRSLHLGVEIEFMNYIFNIPTRQWDTFLCLQTPLLSQKKHKIKVVPRTSHCAGLSSTTSVSPKTQTHHCHWAPLREKFCNKRVSQMQAPLAASREPSDVGNKPTSVLYILEHKKVIFSNQCSTYPHCGILTYQ